MSGLDDLIPQTRSLTVSGRDIVVQVLRVRQYPAFTRAVAKPYDLIVAGQYMAALTEYPDDTIGAIAAATDLEPAFLAELDGHEFLQLAEAVLGLNLDFFARAVFPAALKLAQTMRAAMTSFALSPASSSEATAMATSSSSPLPN